jgi:arsenite methyltransferase
MLTSVKDIRAAVRDRYGRFAADGGIAEACCASQVPAEVSFAVDHGLYGSEELACVPGAARKLSRGCGNPVGFAGVTAGEVVVDVGCGGGIDVILAALLVGDRGSVTGVDMAPEMIERARQAVIEAGVAERTSFVVADMAHTGIPDASVDVIISNCVINLDPEKEAVYREIVRILRPGGRMAISDIVLSEPIDLALSARFRASWPGCVGGAVPEADYLRMIRSAGLTEPLVIARHSLSEQELMSMSCCPGENYVPAPPAGELAAVRGKVTSIKFTATKPN